MSLFRLTTDHSTIFTLLYQMSLFRLTTDHSTIFIIYFALPDEFVPSNYGPQYNIYFALPDEFVPSNYGPQHNIYFAIPDEFAPSNYGPQYNIYFSLPDEFAPSNYRPQYNVYFALPDELSPSNYGTQYNIYIALLQDKFALSLLWTIVQYLPCSMKRNRSVLSVDHGRIFTLLYQQSLLCLYYGPWSNNYLALSEEFAPSLLWTMVLFLPWSTSKVCCVFTMDHGPIITLLYQQSLLRSYYG